MMRNRSCLLHIAVPLLIIVALSGWAFNSGWLWDNPGGPHSDVVGYAEGHYQSGAWTRAKADEFISRDYLARQAIRFGIIVGGVGLVAIIYLIIRNELLCEWL